MTAAWVYTLLGMFVLDFVWARYTRALANGTPLHAALWAMPITVISGLVVVGYVSDPWLLIPGTIGAFLGTYVSMKWGKA